MLRKKWNQSWKVTKTGISSLAAMFSGGSQEAQEVHLPHDAMIHETRCEDTPNGAQTGFYPGGQYVYTKTLEVPKAWEEKTAIVEFEGVYQTAMVYINGDFAGKNLHGYSNFYVTLDPYLKYGEQNEIKVIADNTAEPNSRWYCGSGIYRNVNLLLGGRVHIPADGVRIRTVCATEESAIVEVETKLKNRAKRREAVSVEVTLSKEEKAVARECVNVTVFPEEEDLIRASLCIMNPKLWDCDDPELYHCSIVIRNGNEVLDEYEEHVGIRTVFVDAGHGLRINGKTVKLRGTCIHHDNGIIGAATFEKAEERRCRQMKEAGFNSIRSAHHPMSRAMLDACDRIGMLVMDELSDVWTLHKNRHDFALYFEECWEQEVERMVAKDYNHPSVVLYSTGNEIPEFGTPAGARMNRKICNRIHELDATRYTTAGINGMMALFFGGGIEGVMKDIFTSQAQKRAEMADASDDQEGVNAMNGLMGIMEGEGADLFARHPLLTKAIEENEMALDVIGLNYLTGRHMLEKEIHPNKTIVGTETYPADIVRLWDLVKKNPHVLGDFTWTGYDYLGEAGCGIFHYDGNVNFSSVYPERTAYIGDIDLIGYRRPISYFREIVYGLRKQPYLAVERVDRYGQKVSKTTWMFKDNVASWTWPGYEGKPAVADIYADAEEVELFINGRSLGKKPAGEACGFIATYELAYEPGELLAVSYENGYETGRFSLETAMEVVQLKVEADRTVLKADGEDLSFLTVKLIDEEGRENLFASKEISVSVEGAGSLQGFGSANPSSSESYDAATCKTYDGYAMAVVRAGEQGGKAVVKFSAEGCQSCIVELDVES